MGKFVLIYKGGAMAETPAAQEAAMNEWMGWFGSLGAAVLDGGNPFAASANVGSGGSGASGLAGYSILSADDLAGAVKLAGGCPVLKSGGAVEVYEAMDMG